MLFSHQLPRNSMKTIFFISPSIRLVGQSGSMAIFLIFFALARFLVRYAEFLIYSCFLARNHANTKNRNFSQKNRSFDKNIPKNFGKKKFHEKCSCAMFCTDNLTRFCQLKCCGAAYWTIFLQFDAICSNFQKNQVLSPISSTHKILKEIQLKNARKSKISKFSKTSGSFKQLHKSNHKKPTHGGRSITK